MYFTKTAAVVAAAAVLALPFSSLAADRVPQICASRIYDLLPQPVTKFAIDSVRSDLISDDVYALYQADLKTAAAPLGYDPAATGFTLHETLSTFPFLYYGRVLSLVFVLCATGREKDNDCRHAEYYIDDSVITPERLSLILADTLSETVPAPVDSCDFGLGDWAAVR